MGFLVIVAVSGSAWRATAQINNLSYPDKVFGGSYAFTPKTDEVIVRLASRPGTGADRFSAEQLAASQNLAIARDEGLDDHGIVVYRTTGKAASSVAATLAAEPRVVRAYPALLSRHDA